MNSSFHVCYCVAFIAAAVCPLEFLAIMKLLLVYPFASTEPLFENHYSRYSYRKRMPLMKC